MPTPVNPKPYALKDKVELSIEIFAKSEKPGTVELNRVKIVSQVEQMLDKYRAEAGTLTVDDLEQEKHESAVLAAFMTATGDPRPHELCHAHAIVSGAHKDAAELRAMLAWLKVRIDDPFNGCWLPRNTAAKAHMPPHLRDAVPHSRIHRYNYYFWLNRLINPVATTSRDNLVKALGMIELRLQNGSQPNFVMNPKGEGLPA